MELVKTYTFVWDDEGIEKLKNYFQCNDIYKLQGIIQNCSFGELFNIWCEAEYDYKTKIIKES